MRAWLSAAVVAALVAGTSAEAHSRYEAEITRTTYGIPHIVAKDWGGIGFGVAYAYAQDNLCLLAEQFVTLAGERSLHFGPENTTGPGTANMTNLVSDLSHRALLDVPRLKDDWRGQSARALAVTQGYVAGYNRFLQDAGPQGIPTACRGKAWVRPITLDDMLRLFERQAIQTGLLQFGPAIVAAAPPGEEPARTSSADFPAEDLFERGSNAWAFGGEFTPNGRGLAVGNPHLPWVGLERFWQVHATIPGEYDAMGAALGGVPIPVIGFNRDVGWSHTINRAVHVTLYQLTLAPDDPTAYMLDGEKVAMEERPISVPMPGGADPVRRTIRFTRFGPVAARPGTPFAWSAATAFAVRDANRGNLRMIETWIRIGQAESVGEIEAAIGETLGIPFFTTLAADRAGDALHADISVVPNLTAQDLADCATPLSRFVPGGLVLLDGSLSRCHWPIDPASPVPGLLPARQQAATVRRDYVLNSNNSYWMSHPEAAHPELSPVMGPHASERAMHSMRARANFIETARLVGAGSVDHPRAQALVLGNTSLAADLVLDTLIPLCRERAALARGCEMLAGWDRRFDVDSRGAYLFARFWDRAARLQGLWQVPFDPADPFGTPRQPANSGAIAEKLLDTLAAAIAEVEGHGVALDTPLGEVQAVRIAGGSIPVHGGPTSSGVLNQQTIDQAERIAGGIVPIAGSSYIQIVGFNEDGPVADAILVYSQSVDPASPHFADQTRLFSNKQWVRLPFSAQEIAEQAIGETLAITE